MNQEEREVVSFEALWDSYLKCRRGVSWKPSVKGYKRDDLINTYYLAKRVQSGRWRNSTPRPLVITYPKRREALSIPFRDRIYQRSINDVALYPKVTRSFIYDNAACQTGKGTDFARKRMRKFLWNFFYHHGADGYVLHIDIKGYFQLIGLSLVLDRFRKSVSAPIVKRAGDVLEQHRNQGNGFNPGSQMVQIAGISVLDAVDHFIKEKLHCRYYIRYQDDFWVIHESEDFLWQALFAINECLTAIGFNLHQKKTTITPVTKPFRFLGFFIRLADTGRVVATLDPENVRHERKKLRRLVAKSKRGEIPTEKPDECFKAWKAHAAHGNTKKLVMRMEQYYKTLVKGGAS